MNNHQAAGKIEMMTIFSSGLSRINDFRTYARMGAPCGIVATEASEAVLSALARQVDEEGVPVFVDNNAFATFKQSLKTGSSVSMDFDHVFRIFDKVTASVRRKHLLSLVMPDIIGDQCASLKLIAKYREKILEYVRMGADCLIPLQKGALSLAEVHARVSELLGTSRWRASIPCNAKRIPRRELFELASARRPDRIHLLGIADHKRLLPLVKLILEAHPSADITADANRMRSVIDEDFTRRVKERARDEGEDISFEIADCGYRYQPDFTDYIFGVYNLPGYLSADEARRLAGMLTDDEGERTEIIQAALRQDLAPYCAEIDLDESGYAYASHLGQWLERNTYGDYAYLRIYDFLTKEARKHVHVQLRREEITRAEIIRADRRQKEISTLTLQGELFFR